MHATTRAGDVTAVARQLFRGLHTNVRWQKQKNVACGCHPSYSPPEPTLQLLQILWYQIYTPIKLRRLHLNYGKYIMGHTINKETTNTKHIWDIYIFYGCTLHELYITICIVRGMHCRLQYLLVDGALKCAFVKLPTK